MSLLQVAPNEILLAVLGFGLGIVTTIVSQIVVRRIRFADARLKLRYANLGKFRAWMEAYRDILKCAYPDLGELWLSQVIAPPLGIPVGARKFEDDKAVEIARILKEYWAARRNANKASEIGEEAFHALIEYPSRWEVFRRFSRSREMSTFGIGFTREVIGHLRRFHTSYDFLYDSIERTYAKAKIDWDKLDFIQSNQLESIMVSQLRYIRQNVDERNMSSDVAQEYYRAYGNLADAIGTITTKKREANQELEHIFAIIRKYESKWVVPEG